MFKQTKSPSYTNKGPGRFAPAPEHITEARIKAKAEYRKARKAQA